MGLFLTGISQPKRQSCREPEKPPQKNAIAVFYFILHNSFHEKTLHYENR
jgi:hypothetical protein